MSALDRAAARQVLERMVMKNMHRPTSGVVLDALEGCVRPGPPHTIDRDALIADLNFSRFMLLPDRADRVLALLRPVEGVVLTREEAALAAEALRHVSMHHPEGAAHNWGVRRHALAARLGAAS